MQLRRGSWRTEEMSYCMFVRFLLYRGVCGKVKPQGWRLQHLHQWRRKAAGGQQVADLKLGSQLQQAVLPRGMGRCSVVGLGAEGTGSSWSWRSHANSGTCPILGIPR